MIGMRVRDRTDVQKVLRKARRANIENLGHAGAAIRLTAKRSMRKRKGPAETGKPPHTHTRRLPRAIVYAVEKQRQQVTIGPAYHLAGEVGAAHEHGGRFRGQQYDRRPFMGPALEKVKDRLPRKWAGSVR